MTSRTARIVAILPPAARGSAAEALLDVVGRQSPVSHLVVPLDSAAPADALRRVGDRGVPVLGLARWHPELPADAASTDIIAGLRQLQASGLVLDVAGGDDVATLDTWLTTLHQRLGAGFQMALRAPASVLRTDAALGALATRARFVIAVPDDPTPTGTASDPEASHNAVVHAGLVRPDRIVLDLSRWVDADDADHPTAAAHAVHELARTRHDFGGVAVPATVDPAVVRQLSAAAAAGATRVRQPDPELVLVPSPLAMRSYGVVYVGVPEVVTVRGDEQAVHTLQALLEPGTGLRVEQLATTEADGADDADGAAPFVTVTWIEGDEGAYRFIAEPPGIRIDAVGHAGLVNAIATWRQLLPDWVHGPGPLPGRALETPCVVIEDAPAFGWRGMHLDVARHFQPIDFLFRFVDLLAMHKFNRFHLHLTDDQGWRFPVPQWPLLTTIGAGRTETQNHMWDSSDGTPHGGAYTREQLEALVAYAAERGVTIVPEVDLPGHVRALLAAYPQFGELPPDAGPERRGVATTFGVFDEVLQLTDDTMAMVEDVFTELLDVFPSQWIHVGGDECPRTQWRNSEEAARIAASRGLESVEQLQHWFTEYLRAWLADRGRTMIGWDEVLDDGDLGGRPGEPDGAVIMAWRGDAAGHRAVEHGHQTILMPWQPAYFDRYQSQSAREKYAIGGHTTWQDVATWEPLDGMTDQQGELVLGVQGALWSEYLRDARHVEYTAFPRAAVLAQVAWHGGPVGDLEEFERHLERHLQRLDAAGVDYRPLAGPHLWQQGGAGYVRRPDGHGVDGF